ncbi:hypothetical protein FG379_002914 [Cryptosporidium bovis]|uniref:uncharacterized protein n=1 Tax=Cryptosporidium bovis TaxID=310047 RepID=UPI00351A5EAF|nr:hypothetical protein FG379_002914 [Cryptosporidium bovis]
MEIKLLDFIDSINLSPEDRPVVFDNSHEMSKRSSNQVSVRNKSRREMRIYYKSGTAIKVRGPSEQSLLCRTKSDLRDKLKSKLAGKSEKGSDDEDSDTGSVSSFDTTIPSKHSDIKDTHSEGDLSDIKGKAKKGIKGRAKGLYKALSKSVPELQLTPKKKHGRHKHGGKKKDKDKEHVKDKKKKSMLGKLSSSISSIFSSKSTSSDESSSGSDSDDEPPLSKRVTSRETIFIEDHGMKKKKHKKRHLGKHLGRILKKKKGGRSDSDSDNDSDSNGVPHSKVSPEKKTDDEPRPKTIVVTATIERTGSSSSLDSSGEEPGNGRFEHGGGSDSGTSGSGGDSGTSGSGGDSGASGYWCIWK